MLWGNRSNRHVIGDGQRVSGLCCHKKGEDDEKNCGGGRGTRSRKTNDKNGRSLATVVIPTLTMKYQPTALR